MGCIIAALRSCSLCRMGGCDFHQKRMTQQEHLAKIRARCVELLAIAEKRTPGKWKAVDNANNHWGKVEVEGPRVRCIGFTQADDVSFEQGITTRADRDFIASCAGNFEASLRSTIAAIDCLLFHKKSNQGGWEGDYQAREKAIGSIIAAWPEELL